MNDERLMSDLAEIAERQIDSPAKVLSLQVEAVVRSYVRELQPTDHMVKAGVQAMATLPQSHDVAELVRTVWQAMSKAV